MKENKSFNIVKASMSLSGVLLIIKFISFFRDMLLARNLGATVYSDVFLASQSILMVFVSFILSPFAAAYLPVATDYYLKESKKRKNEFFGTVYGAASCLGIVVIILEAIFIEEIIQIIIPGFDKQGKQLLIEIIYIQLPIIFCTFLFGINKGNLRLVNKFNLAETSNIFAPLICIIYLAVRAQSSTVTELSVCVVVGYIIALLLQFYGIRKSGITPKLNFKFLHNEDLKQIIFAMAPFMIAGVARELNALIDKSIGSLLPEGSITMLSYASKITITEVGLISIAISLVVFSQMSKQNSLNDNDGLRSTLVHAIKFVNTLIIPISVLTIILRIDIITVLFGGGAFDENSVKITADTMMFYAIGMFGFGMQDVLMRGMHATKHRKFPAMVSVLMVAINICLNLLFYKKLGTYGLALASSLAVLAIIPIIYIYSNKKVVTIKKEDRIGKDTLITVLSSILMGGVAYGVDKMIFGITGSNLIALICSSIVAILVYLVCMIITKNEIIMSLINKRIV